MDIDIWLTSLKGCCTFLGRESALPTLGVILAVDNRLSMITEAFFADLMTIIPSVGVRKMHPLTCGFGEISFFSSSNSFMFLEVLEENWKGKLESPLLLRERPNEGFRAPNP